MLSAYRKAAATNKPLAKQTPQETLYYLPCAAHCRRAASRTRHEKIAATNKQASRSLVKKNFAPLPLATGQNWKLAASNSQLATGNWQQETAPRALNHLPRGQEGLAHRAGRRASSGESSLAQRGGVPLADALWKRQPLLVKAARLCHSRSPLPKAPVVALLIRAARLPFPKPPAARLG